MSKQVADAGNKKKDWVPSLNDIESALSQGESLKQWWWQTGAKAVTRFPLIAKTHSAARTWGFFADAPVRLGLCFLNTATAGLSDDWFGYSWERVVKNVFGNHFNEAYDFFKQASVSWRLIPDWADEKSLPKWVKQQVMLPD